MLKTQMIAGHKITLEEGQRYMATRPMAVRFQVTYPVTISKCYDQEVDGNSGVLGEDWEVIIERLSYDESNQFLNEFNSNNGAITIGGRVW